MLKQATLNVAAREEQISPHVMDARPLSYELLLNRLFLSAFKVSEGSRKVVCDALDCCEPNQGPAPLRPRPSGGQCTSIGQSRCGHVAQIVQDISLKAGQSGPVGGLNMSSRPRSTKRRANS